MKVLEDFPKPLSLTTSPAVPRTLDIWTLTFACAQLKHVHPGEDHLLCICGGSDSAGSISACKGRAGCGCCTLGLPHHPPLFL